jgi:hypothetical protein
MMSFAPCPACRRHVARTEPACPFCGAAITVVARVPSYAGRLTRAAIFAGAAACSQTPPPQPSRPPPVEHPFALPPAPADGRASLSGVVRLDGYREAGIAIEAQREDGTTVETYTNAKGEFQFLDLAPGAYRIVPKPGYTNPRPQDGPVMQMAVEVQLAPNANERRDLSLVGPMPYTPDTGPCCKPYGAPPARRRVV